MKAVIINSFGNSDVLELRGDVPEPLLGTNQVMIAVKATSVNPLDVKTRQGLLRPVLGSGFPIILGNDAAGTIVKCGADVHDFKVGDKVYCMLDANRRPGYSGFAKSGTYAELAVTREDTLAHLPDKFTFEQAASLPLCSLTAYQALVKKAKIQKDYALLVNGASGGVGVYAVQIAKYLGAKVTAVCSKKNVDLMRDLGADRVIDYAETNWADQGEKYDIVYDVIAGTTYRKCRHALKDCGTYISNIAPLLFFVLPFLRNVALGGRQAFAWVEPSGKDLRNITKMANEGFLKPVIDAIYSMEQIRQAHDYSGSGRVAGKLVVRI